MISDFLGISLYGREVEVIPKCSVLREILLFVAQYIMCCALINSIECHYLRCPISRIMHPISVSSPNLAVPPSLLASPPPRWRWEPRAVGGREPRAARGARRGPGALERGARRQVAGGVRLRVQRGVHVSHAHIHHPTTR